MAQVKFYGMTLDFQFVRDYFKTPEFKKFILQPYMEDAEKWRDEYFLLIYAIDEKGSSLLCILVLVNTENMFLIKSWLLQNHSETLPLSKKT